MLHKALLTFESLDEIRISTKQLKGVTQCFPVVLFIMLHMVVLTFWVCRWSHERHLSNKKTCGLSKTGLYRLELYSCGNLDSWLFSVGYLNKFCGICCGNCRKKKPSMTGNLENYKTATNRPVLKKSKRAVPVVLFLTLYLVVLTVWSVDAIVTCIHSMKSYWAALSCVLLVSRYFVNVYLFIDLICNFEFSGVSKLGISLTRNISPN